MAQPPKFSTNLGDFFVLAAAAAVSVIYRREICFEINKILRNVINLRFGFALSAKIPRRRTEELFKAAAPVKESVQKGPIVKCLLRPHSSGIRSKLRGQHNYKG